MSTVVLVRALLWLPYGLHERTIHRTVVLAAMVCMSVAIAFIQKLSRHPY